MRFIAGGANWAKWRQQRKQEIHNSCCEQLAAVNVCLLSARKSVSSGWHLFVQKSVTIKKIALSTIWLANANWSLWLHKI